MSKLLKNFVGIDISKTYFDAAIVKGEGHSTIIHQQFSQTREGFLKMSRWLYENDVAVTAETLFCMEYTGLYNSGLVNYLIGCNAQLWVEMPLRIKKAAGFERGSDDKSAAIKIAWYALRYNDQMKLWQPVDSSIEKIKNLIAQRDRVVNAITQLSVPVNELKEAGCSEDAKVMEKLQKPALTALQKTKIAIETMILKTVQADELLNKNPTGAISKWHRLCYCRNVACIHKRLYCFQECKRAGLLLWHRSV